MTRSRPRRPLLLILLAIAVLGVAYLAVSASQVVLGASADEPLAGEAIVVLGAAQYDGAPSPALEQRLQRAHALWEDGVAPVIVVTGGKLPQDQFTEAGAGSIWLQARGVPEEAIRREVQSANTYDQLAATARLLRDEGISSVVLVSHDLHAARLRAIAAEVGLEATVAPVPSHRAGPAWSERLVRETGSLAAGQLMGFRRLRNVQAALADD